MSFDFRFMTLNGILRNRRLIAEKKLGRISIKPPFS